MFGKIIPCDTAYSPPAMVIDVEIGLPNGERLLMRGIIDSGSDLTVVSGSKFVEHLESAHRGFSFEDHEGNSNESYHLDLFVFGVRYSPDDGIGVYTSAWPYGNEELIIGRDMMNFWKITYYGGRKPIAGFMIERSEEY